MSAPGHMQKLAIGSRDDWETPPELFGLLDEKFHFTLDAAASAENAKCERFYTFENSAFKQDPTDEVIWCNPPFGRGMSDWIALFNHWSHRNTVVALTPSNTETQWWAKAYYSAHRVLLLTGRVQFLDPETGRAAGNNPGGSTVFVFGGTEYPLLDKVTLWDWRAELGG